MHLKLRPPFSSLPPLFFYPRQLVTGANRPALSLEQGFPSALIYYSAAGMSSPVRRYRRPLHLTLMPPVGEPKGLAQAPLLAPGSTPRWELEALRVAQFCFRKRERE